MRHVRHLDRGCDGEELARQVRLIADTERAVVERARARPAQGNDLLHRLAGSEGLTTRQAMLVAVWVIGKVAKCRRGNCL